MTKKTEQQVEKGSYSYLYHYNEYTGLWAAFDENDRQNYFEKRYPHEGSKALFSENFQVLADMVNQGALVEQRAKDNTTIYKHHGLEEPK